jgi:hypothetical protein
MAEPKFNIDVEEKFKIGSDTYFTSILDGNSYGVAFEDDLETGYFYAFRVAAEGVILDALHIYDVKDVVFKDELSKLNILWTLDGTIAALLINDYCHAVFDFEKRLGYCRNGFPENVGEWKQQESRKLTDEMILDIFS